MEYQETQAFLADKKCAFCGKHFIAYPQHVFKESYKRNGKFYTKYYCKWTCYNHRNDKKGVKNERTNKTDTE